VNGSVGAGTDTIPAPTGTLVTEPEAPMPTGPAMQSPLPWPHYVRRARDPKSPAGRSVRAMLSKHAAFPRQLAAAELARVKFGPIEVASRADCLPAIFSNCRESCFRPLGNCPDEQNKSASYGRRRYQRFAAVITSPIKRVVVIKPTEATIAVQVVRLTGNVTVASARSHNVTVQIIFKLLPFPQQ
jgi:hypothetical protein